MGGQNFVFFFFSSGGLDCFFCTLAKKYCKFLMCSLILKFGTNKEHIKENSGTEFGMNLMCKEQ